MIKKTESRRWRGFRERSELIADKPKPEYGKTNNGNTVRRFFKRLELFADIN